VDIATRDDRGRLEKTEQGMGNGRFATAGFAGQAQDFARVEVEADCIGGADRTGRRHIFDGQLAHFEQWHAAVANRLE
jgi:hypothetical protein